MTCHIPEEAYCQAARQINQYWVVGQLRPVSHLVAKKANGHGTSGHPGTYTSDHKVIHESLIPPRTEGAVQKGKVISRHWI